MLEQVSTMIATFFGDTPNYGVTALSLRRAIEAQAVQLYRGCDENMVFSAALLDKGKPCSRAELSLSGAGQAAQLYEPRQTLDTKPAERVPAELEAYVRKVALHAYQITDNDIAELKQAGYSEDELFEITISAALGAAQICLCTGLAALSEEEERHAS